MLIAWEVGCPEMDHYVKFKLTGNIPLVIIYPVMEYKAFFPITRGQRQREEVVSLDPRRRLGAGTREWSHGGNSWEGELPTPDSGGGGEIYAHFISYQLIQFLSSEQQGTLTCPASSASCFSPRIM